MSNPVRTVAPTATPISIAEAKEHLRVDASDEDESIAIYIAAATAHLDGARGWLGRALALQTWQEQFPGFCRRIRLAVAPVVAISSVAYADADGVAQTVGAENYVIDGDDLVFVEDYSFPTTRGNLFDLTVTYQAGYASIPDDLRAAMLLIVGDLYANREGQSDDALAINATVRMLLEPHRRSWIS